VTSKLVFGSVLHEVLAAYHRGIQLGSPLAIDKAKRLFLLLWQLRESDELIQYSGETREQLFDQAGQLIELYFMQSPPANIIGVERSFMVPLVTSSGEILDKPLLAVIDLLTREDGQLTIHEFKTSGRRFSESSTDRELQATCYKHAVEVQFDEPAAVQYQVLVRTQRPSLQSLQLEGRTLNAGRLGDLAQSVGHAISANVFYPV